MEIQPVTDLCPWPLPLGHSLDALAATSVLRDLSLRAIALEAIDWAQARASVDGPYAAHDHLDDLLALAACETTDLAARAALAALFRTERGVA